MKTRSECKCICHDPGIEAIHVMPCCEPDEVVFRKAIDECPIDHNHCLPGFQCKTCGYLA